MYSDHEYESQEEIISWVRRFCPSFSVDECLEAYDVYISYREEGQSDIVSRQYAGLL